MSAIIVCLDRIIMNLGVINSRIHLAFIYSIRSFCTIFDILNLHSTFILIFQAYVLIIVTGIGYGIARAAACRRGRNLRFQTLLQGFQLINSRSIMKIRTISNIDDTAQAIRRIFIAYRDNLCCRRTC